LAIIAFSSAVNYFKHLLTTDHSSLTTEMDNPFSTRCTRPGAIAFRFAPDFSVAALVDRLNAAGKWGQIVGPHGSGKSTLLTTLESELKRTGTRVLHIELHDGQRRPPIHLGDALQHEPFDLVVVDGYEQLSRFHRYRLRAFCQKHKLGLVVTSHTSVCLPELFRTAVTPELAQQIVADLLHENPSAITPEMIADRLAHHQGNLREVLMDLYSLYENSGL